VATVAAMQHQTTACMPITSQSSRTAAYCSTLPMARPFALGITQSKRSRHAIDAIRRETRDGRLEKRGGAQKSRKIARYTRDANHGGIFFNKKRDLVELEMACGQG
jgi:hypothetical protein